MNISNLSRWSFKRQIVEIITEILLLADDFLRLMLRERLGIPSKPFDADQNI
jgi:hypothetical protein